MKFITIKIMDCIDTMFSNQLKQIIYFEGLPICQLFERYPMYLPKESYLVFKSCFSYFSISIPALTKDYCNTQMGLALRC